MIFVTTYHHDDLGALTIASDGPNIIGLWMEGQKYFGSKLPQPFEPRDDLPVLAHACVWLDRYFAGDRPSPHELPLAPQGTPFQHRVWNALVAIPYGQMRTYADLALQVAQEDGGGSGSARAVGAANGRNPISIIIPCHRVVGSNGSLTGYAGGTERKLWLLRHEHADTAHLFIPKRGTAR